jgi:hypothetical protein
MDNNTHMIIDKLNTLMGTSTSHIIQNTTNDLYATATFTDGLILLTDNPYKLYKKTGGTKTAVAEPTNTDVVNATVNMMQPDGYIGVTIDDIIDPTWPPKIPNSRTYVCNSFTTLFGLTGIKKGEIAIIGDYTYLLITFNYRNTADWIQLKSRITDFTLISGFTKDNVGLPNADNTSDLNKPISTATQTALGLKADQTAMATALGLKSDKSTTYTKTEVDSLLAAKQTQITALQTAVAALQ